MSGTGHLSQVQDPHGTFLALGFLAIRDGDGTLPVIDIVGNW